MGDKFRKYKYSNELKDYLDELPIQDLPKIVLLITLAIKKKVSDNDLIKYEKLSEIEKLMAKYITSVKIDKEGKIFAPYNSIVIFNILFKLSEEFESNLNKDVQKIIRFIKENIFEENEGNNYIAECTVKVLNLLNEDMLYNKYGSNLSNYRNVRMFTYTALDYLNSKDNINEEKKFLLKWLIEDFSIDTTKYLFERDNLEQDEIMLETAVNTLVSVFDKKEIIDFYNYYKTNTAPSRVSLVFLRKIIAKEYGITIENNDAIFKTYKNYKPRAIEARNLRLESKKSYYLTKVRKKLNEIPHEMLPKIVNMIASCKMVDLSCRGRTLFVDEKPENIIKENYISIRVNKVYDRTKEILELSAKWILGINKTFDVDVVFDILIEIINDVPFRDFSKYQNNIETNFNDFDEAKKNTCEILEYLTMHRKNTYWPERQHGLKTLSYLLKIIKEYLSKKDCNDDSKQFLLNNLIATNNLLQKNEYEILFGRVRIACEPTILGIISILSKNEFVELYEIIENKLQDETLNKETEEYEEYQFSQKLLDYIMSEKLKLKTENDKWVIE